MFPPTVQLLLQNHLVYGLTVAMALAAVITLIHWGREPGFIQRKAFVTSILISSSATFIINLIAPALGWWSGPVFDTPILPFVLLIALKALAYFSFFLSLYRWLAKVQLIIARIVYLGLVICLLPITIYADKAVLESGAMAFDNGYEIWHDVAFAVLIFSLPPVLYEIFYKRWNTVNEI